MARQGVSSDKAEEHFDGSSGINLIVLCKVLGDRHVDCSVGSYPVLLDQDPLTHGQWRYSMRELCCGGAHALQSPLDFLIASSLGSLSLHETLQKPWNCIDILVLYCAWSPISDKHHLQFLDMYQCSSIPGCLLTVAENHEDQRSCMKAVSTYLGVTLVGAEDVRNGRLLVPFRPFAMLGNTTVFWCCFSGVGNLYGLVCLVYILDKLSLWSCFLPMLFLC